MRIVAFTCLASLIALPAIADRNPQPKPSGITIHLFGPDFITTTNSSSTSPASGGATSSPSSVPSTSRSVTINGVPAPLSSGSSSSPQQAEASPAVQPEPTMGDILHEMFVTGDPAQEGRYQFPRGKASTNHP